MNKEFLLTLLNKVVKVDRGGPESRIGKLMDVKDDHFVLLTEKDGVVYYSSEHIKSITENVKHPMNLKLEVPEDFEFITGENLSEVLTNIGPAWVKVNRGGPESVEGVLNGVSEDGIVTVISNEEIIYLALDHIRNFSYGLKLEEKEDESDNGDNGDNGDSDDDNSDGNGVGGGSDDSNDDDN